ncbi:hypothetical protein Pyn_00869 [Prunus yedoensis var. nudiflora]|uniref:Uncharacterized protein n=1 Tax=Prunus yedoensis var. nudiflora TaxID=2094558 RepID=A0A314XZ34_PRUYE|nr:hypothetical protein Pyn_00869 [Prunus yedoensis var. nudiflora]
MMREKEEEQKGCRRSSKRRRRSRGKGQQHVGARSLFTESLGRVFNSSDQSPNPNDRSPRDLSPCAVYSFELLGLGYKK